MDLQGVLAWPGKFAIGGCFATEQTTLVSRQTWDGFDRYQMAAGRNGVMV